MVLSSLTHRSVKRMTAYILLDSKNESARKIVIWLFIEETNGTIKELNLLKTERRLLYSKAQSVPHCKHFISVIKNN
jgi:hypothetical protein